MDSSDSLDFRTSGLSDFSDAPPTLTQFLTRELGQLGVAVPSFKGPLPASYDEDYAAWEEEVRAYKERSTQPYSEPVELETIDKGLLDMRSMMR